MSTGELLSIDPVDLQFPFELKKQISCSLQFTNKTDNHVAFKVKTTNPKKYCVRPNCGVVLPRSTCDCTVTMRAQKEAPPSMECSDKFLLQSTVTSPGITAQDLTQETFYKEMGHIVEETRLRVVYVAPFPESAEEVSSPSDLIPASDKVSKSRDDKVELRAGSSEFQERRALISKLSEEKKSFTQRNKKLQQELMNRNGHLHARTHQTPNHPELMRQQSSRSNGGISVVYVLIVGLLGFLLGYLVERV